MSLRGAISGLGLEHSNEGSPAIVTFAKIHLLIKLSRRDTCWDLIINGDIPVLLPPAGGGWVELFPAQPNFFSGARGRSNPPPMLLSKPLPMVWSNPHPPMVWSNPHPMLLSKPPWKKNQTLLLWFLQTLLLWFDQTLLHRWFDRTLLGRRIKPSCSLSHKGGSSYSVKTSFQRSQRFFSDLHVWCNIVRFPNPREQVRRGTWLDAAQSHEAEWKYRQQVEGVWDGLCS